MENDPTIRDLMSRQYVGVSESDTVQGTVELMREEGAGSVVVLRGTEPVGMMTEWDVLEIVADQVDPLQTTVAEVMSSPVVSMDADRRLGDAAETMSRHNIRRMVVVDGDEVVGVLTERDIIAASASFSTVPAQNAPRRGRFDVEDDHTDTRSYAGQSICESCGSLTTDLTSVNGQLLCGNCIEM